MTDIQSTSSVPQAPATKTTFGISNFSANNTPPILQTIGDWCLRLGVIGAALIALPTILPATILATIPASVLTVTTTAGGIGVALGTLGKTFTKLFGSVTTPAGS